MSLRKIFVVGVLILSSVAHAADVVEIDYEQPQRLDARYRLFKTRNMWNFVELDTQTGRTWQVQFSIDGDDNRKKMPIGTEVLAKDGRNGRFTIYLTRNMYNMILLDQDTGKTWQVQWTTQGAPGQWAIEPKADKPDSGWKQ